MREQQSVIVSLNYEHNREEKRWTNLTVLKYLQARLAK